MYQYEILLLFFMILMVWLGVTIIIKTIYKEFIHCAIVFLFAIGVVGTIAYFIK